MPDLGDGESVEMKGSGARPYVLKNVGGVYSCTCPAWRNQSVAIERRTCKHLRKLRGDAAEQARVGQDLPPAPEGTGRGRGGQGRAAAAAGRALGQRAGPGRLVDEREARRRPRLLGRPDLHLAPGQHVPRPRLVPRRACPRTPLDGELWVGRKEFQRTVGIVRRQDKSDCGRRSPSSSSTPRRLDAPFEERLAFVRDHAERHRPPHFRAHEHAPARAWSICATSWRGSRRSAARG